jgi:protease-4
MKFLSNVLAVIVGLFVFSIMAFFLMIVIAAVASGGDDKTYVEKNSVIDLDLDKVTLDYAGKSHYKEFDYNEASHDGVTDVVRAIAAAKTDDKIKGISILNHTSELGVVQSKMIRDALIDFKKSGKFVLAYSNVYTQKDYYVASVADTVYLNPVGMLEFKGLSTDVSYFKDLEDKAGINVEVVRHGKYKSAVEPFLQNSMSDANREQLTMLLHSVWNSVVTGISESRRIPVPELERIASGILVRTPEDAKALKLVDKIVYEDQYDAAIRHALHAKKKDGRKYPSVKILDYAKNVANTGQDFTAHDRIAIIYAQGDLLSGEGSENYIGDGAIRRALSEVRDDDDVKAVVLRIDSPGGSALTAELIWREIELTKKKKPVIVSMGNLAASGGYYIACNGNRIFAENSTITGSIGVFGMLPNANKLAEKIGVKTYRVATYDNDAEYSPLLPPSDKFRDIAQAEVEQVYKTFVSRVAAGRHMTFDQVDAIGQGRVWAGSDAIRIGLVDEIGGLKDAIAYAAKSAKITKYRTQDYPEYEKSFADMLKNLGLPFASASEDAVKETVGAANYKLLQQLRAASQRTGVQALLPYSVEIK